MVPGDKARLMEKVKCSLSSLIQIALQEVPSLPELVCWFCEEPAKTYLTFSFDLLVPRTCAFTANMMGQESLTFYPPNSATGEKDKLRRGKRQDEMLRMPRRKQGDLTISHLLYSSPARTFPYTARHAPLPGGMTNGRRFNL